MQTKLFPLLEEILDRENMSEKALPSNIEQWREFIQHINNCFNDFEQERYLLERSMEISSREMLELNERFEIAQGIAHIGYWFYNPPANQILWSKETYQLFGLDPSLSVPPYEKVMQLVHEDDREYLQQLIDHALTEGKDYEMEFRIRNAKDNNIYWMYVKGHPYKKQQATTDAKNDEYLLSGVVMDITERKLSEESMHDLTQQLIMLSRQAGMSEVATSVLHNIGNILNSLNISTSLIKETVEHSEIKNLIKISQMINENLPKQPDYLASDPKGKLIPGYLSTLAEVLLFEYNRINDELSNFSRSICHIKDIVVMQKDISIISGVNEKVYLSELCDLAFKMSCASPEKHGIRLIKKYEYSEFVITDKTKLLQILVNLITNAKDAISIKKQASQKTLTVTIKKPDADRYIEICIQDTGVGISKANLLKVFNMGFTTKLGGHGFGLHSSALAANELGGRLIVESEGEGEGKGATFTLRIPKEPIEKETNANNQRGKHHARTK